MIPGDAQLLTIHVGANLRHDGKSLYEAIVEKARALGLAGASVFPVEQSFAGGGQIHDVRSEYAFVELPVVVEIVDTREQIKTLLSELGGMIDAAMVTTEPARVIRYSHSEV
jgi:PII-like signaling protein